MAVETRDPAILPPGVPFAGERKVEVSKHNRTDLLEHAAELAVDMEEGKYRKPDGTPWSGSYSKAEIADVMGWERPGNGRDYPIWMQEPGFSNWVQFARIKRSATASASLSDAKPLVAVGAMGMLLELVKRVLTQPELIGNRELFLETRKWFELLNSLDSGEEKRTDAVTIINVFNTSIMRLPKGAGEKARAFMTADLDRLMRAANTPIEAKAKAS
jgi:hypothetical protein